MFRCKKGDPTIYRVCDVCSAVISDKLGHLCNGCGKELCEKHSKGMLIWKLSTHSPVRELIEYEIASFNIELCKNCQTDKTLRRTKLATAAKELLRIEEERQEYSAVVDVR